jgi:TetR/AcrR family transcriptional regulator, regulator of autoinduction and epiphytic fitness
MARTRTARSKTRSVVSSRDRIREAAKRLFAERGYEGTSTAGICSLAGTSQSQLVKHFVDKQGLLDAVFEHAWEQINPTLRLATEAISEPREKLRVVTEIMFNVLVKDRELRTIFLLEGRRIRGDGHMVVLVPGYLEFIKVLDAILNEMAERGELQTGIHPAALRSGLMGVFEALLRDQLLSSTSKFPASYNDNDIRRLFYTFLASCMTK